jgi:hypothetical protein
MIGPLVRFHNNDKQNRVQLNQYQMKVIEEQLFQVILYHLLLVVHDWQ